MTSESYLAIIPARAGSKGIRNKNLLKIQGKELIRYTLDAAIESRVFKEIVVTTDDIGVIDICKELNITCKVRPKDLAGDLTPMAPVVLDVIREFPKFENLVLLQPTSPLRTINHIREAVSNFESRQCDSLISVKLAENDCLKFLKKNNGYLTGIAGNEMPFMRRQDLPVVYKPNGAIYIISREKFAKYGSFMTSQTVEFVMDSDSSHDVDVWNDVKMIEKILDERREKNTSCS